MLSATPSHTAVTSLVAPCMPIEVASFEARAWPVSCAVTTWSAQWDASVPQETTPPWNRYGRCCRQTSSIKSSGSTTGASRGHSPRPGAHRVRGQADRAANPRGLNRTSVTSSLLTPQAAFSVINPAHTVRADGPLSRTRGRRQFGPKVVLLPLRLDPPRSRHDQRGENGFHHTANNEGIEPELKCLL